MMGHSHAVSGMLAWSAAIAATIPAHHVAVATAIGGLLVTAGAALLPDFDQVKSTISATGGPLTKGLARLVGRLSGGHRHATHSLLAVVTVTAASWLTVHLGGRIAALALMFPLLLVALRALHLAIHHRILAATTATLAAAFLLPGRMSWLPLAVGLGVATHLAGDCLTREGCPLLWPLRVRVRLPIIRRTGNRLERRLVTPVMGVAAMALLINTLTGLHP